MDDPSSQIPYHVIGLIGNLISKIDGPGGPGLSYMHQHLPHVNGYNYLKLLKNNIWSLSEHAGKKISDCQAAHIFILIKMLT